MRRCEASIREMVAMSVSKIGVNRKEQKKKKKRHNILKTFKLLGRGNTIIKNSTPFLVMML